NTYLETYLNSGLIGLGLLLAVLLSSAIRIKQEAMKSESFGAFRFGCFVPLLLYGVTEAYMNRLGFPWLLLILVTMHYPKKIPAQTGQRGVSLPKRTVPREVGARVHCGGSPYFGRGLIASETNGRYGDFVEMEGIRQSDVASARQAPGNRPDRRPVTGCSA